MNRNTLVAAVLTAASTLIALPAFAQSADAWRYKAALNLYLPDISGRTTFPDGAGSSVSVDAQTILEKLKMVFMGSFEASRGNWGVFTDVLYMDVGDTRSQFHEFVIGGVPLPGGANVNASFDLKGWVWTLGGVWHRTSEPGLTFDVLGGVRLFDMKAALDWDVTGNVGSIPLPGRAGSAKAGLSNWDAIVGVKGRVGFGESGKWFVPYYADIGTGDSKLTWQAMGGIGYAFNWGDVVGAWRHVDYDMKSGKAIESLTFSGPSISAVFRW